MLLSSELTQIPIIEERLFGSKTALIRVLHVDDDQLLLEVSKQILSLEGCFEIENVLCVDDAFQKLSLGSYDVILSDYEMPQKDGLQFLKELKEQKSTIPFILFTGKGREEVAIKALNMGAVGYYTKQGDIETVYGELAHGIKTAYELKKVKEQRRQQDLSRKILLDNIPCVAMILEKKTRRIIFSNKLAHVQGAVPGKTCYSTCASRSTPCTFCLASKLWETGQPQSLEVEYEGKYYHGIWVPYNENHYVHYIFDISKQKEAEKTIIESNNRYAQLFAATPAGVAVYEAINDGEDFVFKDFNPTAEKIEKKTKQAVVGQKVTEVFPGVKEFGVFEVFQRVWRSGNPEYFPISIYTDEHNTGSWRENWVYKISDKEIVAIYRDVTERKKAEENFDHSEKKFRTLFESMAQGAFWQAADGTLLDVNDSALKMFGISREEFLNRNSLSPKWTVIKEDGTELPGEQHPSMIALRTGKAVRNFTAGVFNPKRNSYVWINVNAIPQFKNVQEMPHEVLVTLHELTERPCRNKRAKPTRPLRAQKLLVENETKYRSLFLSMNEGVCLHELIYDESGKAVDYKIIDVNPAYEQITEIKRSDALDKLASELYGSNEPPYLEIYSRVAETGKSESFDTFFSPMNKYFFISVFSPAKGKFATVFTDSTSQKKNESDLSIALEALSTTLQKQELLNEKLRVVGSLSRHDVRNKLSTVTGYSYILRKKYSDKADIVEAIDKMVEAVQNSMKIFEFAKTYEQLGVEELVDVDVESTVAWAVDMFSNLPFKVVNECQGLIVHADSLLRQLIYNFIDNTRKHGQKAIVARVYYQKIASGELELIYEDDGVGVPQESKEHLFKKGFSTGGGTGFGLFLSKKMMEVYGWNIQEIGEPCKGAKFVITIPLHCYQCSAR